MAGEGGSCRTVSPLYGVEELSCSRLVIVAMQHSWAKVPGRARRWGLGVVCAAHSAVETGTRSGRTHGMNRYKAQFGRTGPDLG